MKKNHKEIDGMDIVNMGSDKPAPYIQVLEGYVSRWATTDDFSMPKIQYRPSQDIVDELADMVDLTCDQVTEFMLAKGFSLNFKESGGHGWAMVPVPWKR